MHSVSLDSFTADFTADFQGSDISRNENFNINPQVKQ